jgi:arabinan endo-1,5-alpha-L-arabinosidase
MTTRAIAVCCAALMCAGLLQREARADLVAMWLLDEGSGDVVADESGNGHEGILEGDYEWLAAGKFGSALNFTQGRVRVDHADDMDLVDFSMAIWIKLPGATGTYQMVMGKEGWPDRNYSMWVLPTNMTAGFTSGADDIQVGGGEVANDEWHYLVATYDGSELIAYVDGVVAGQRGAAGDPNTCACPFFIGSQPPAGGGPAVGAIDEVAVYNHALDEDEVADTMEGLQSLAVSASGKLATRWGALKSRVR